MDVLISMQFLIIKSYSTPSGSHNTNPLFHGGLDIEMTMISNWSYFKSLSHTIVLASQKKNTPRCGAFFCRGFAL